MASNSDVLKMILSDPEGFNNLPEDTRQKLLQAAGVQDNSLTAKAKRFVTGEGQKEFDYPDFDPDYLDPGFKPGLTGMPDPRTMVKDNRKASYNATVHNDARMEVLKNYRPDIAQTAKKDSYGNPYVVVDGKPFYLNRPGASMQDAREAGAVVTAALPFLSRSGRTTTEGAPMPKTFVQKGLTSPSVIARGATAGAVGAGASALQDLVAGQGGATEGISGQRAATAGLLSTGTVFAWPIIRTIGVKPFQAIFSRPTLPNGQFTTEAIEAMRVSGVDPSSFTVAERAEVARLMKDATDPGSMAAVEQALSLDPQVRLTKGQATGDRAQQALEFQAREGLVGDSAKEQMLAFDADAKAAMAENIQKMRQRLVGATPPNEMHVGTGQAQLELGQDRIAAKAKYGQLYKDIETFSDEALAWVDTPERFRQTVLNMPEVKVDREFNKRLDSIIKDYETNVMKLQTGPAGPGGTTGSAAPSVNEMFAWRRRLNASMQSATPSENIVLRKVKQAYDKFMQDTVAQGLVRGDPKLIGMWTEANKSRALYGRMFEGKDIVDRITKLTPDGLELAVDPSDATNLIFGASDTGFASKWNIVKNVQQLKQRLSPQSWQALRGEALLKMFGLTRSELESIAAGSAQLPSGQKFQSAVEALRTKNAALFKTLFDDEESRLISKVADVWKRVTVPKQGAANPSGSGLWAIQASRRVINGPMGGLLKELLALASPTARYVIKPIKGSIRAGAATGHGEGYYPPTKTLAPPAPAVSPIVGGEGERLLDKYENAP